MINNARLRYAWPLALLLAAAGCAKASAQREEPLQGVVEYEQSTIGFELGGRVDQLHVKEGDRVAKGAPIATLDDELTQKQLAARTADAESARAELERVKSGARSEDIRAMAERVEAAKASEGLLEKNLARERALYEKNVVALAGVDQLEAQLARAQAERRALEQNLLSLKRGAKIEDVEVAAARADAAQASLGADQVRLERHQLHAPIDAEILDKHVEVGEVVAAGSAVVTLADTAHPYVDVFVPQGKLAGITVGTSARVKVDAESESLPGKVEHVAQKTEFTPRFLFSERERPNLVVRVRVRIDDPKRRLHAGVPAFVTIAQRSP
ncbi:MAG TPA: HlyD family efflux transporter periplasmic adaptor subunit [Polyangiaceae bacterium]|nr:HlyD family efflux transporter periplasmic adaptor subunit [Polyangiaceae bacterium]